jgi:hypothetical protein
VEGAALGCGCRMVSFSRATPPVEPDASAGVCVCVVEGAVLAAAEARAAPPAVAPNAANLMGVEEGPEAEADRSAREGVVVAVVLAGSAAERDAKDANEGKERQGDASNASASAVPPKEDKFGEAAAPGGSAPAARPSRTRRSRSGVALGCRLQAAASPPKDVAKSVLRRRF